MKTQQKFPLNDELVRSLIEREQNRRESLLQWWTRTKAKIELFLQGEESLKNFYIPTIFDLNDKDRYLWQNEIQSWCRSHNLNWKIQTEDDVRYLVVRKQSSSK